MATLIDASLLIAVERRYLDFSDLKRGLGEAELALSAIGASELLHGIYRTASVALRSRRQAFVEGILARMPVIEFDLNAARVHASLWADLARRGLLVGERDLLIAATALARGYSVATHDQRSFPKIPGLKVAIF